MSIQESRRSPFESHEREKDPFTTLDMSKFNGVYIDDAREQRWADWNAALDSVVVVLPDGDSYIDVEAAEWAITDCKHAITAAGIRVEVAK